MLVNTSVTRCRSRANWALSKLRMVPERVTESGMTLGAPSPAHRVGWFRVVRAAGKLCGVA